MTHRDNKSGFPHLPKTDPSYSAIGFGAVSLAIFFAFLPFVDFDYRISYQYDTPIFLIHSQQFIEAWKNRNSGLMPALTAWPPYFDAYTIIVTLLTLATEQLGGIFKGIDIALPDEVQRVNFWIRWLALGCFAFGMGFLWLALERINRRPLTNLVLVFLVAFAPTVMDMDMGRNDFAVLGGVCAAFYFLFTICWARPSSWSLTALSVTVALLATLKINGPAFGIFLLVALVVLWRSKSLSRRNLVWLFLPGAALGLLFMSRQLYYLPEFLPNFRAQVADVARWAEGQPKDALFYYSWNILADHGSWFRIMIWASLPIVLVYAFLSRRSDLRAFIAIYLLFLGWSLVVDYAFARGGYHLLPMFVILIASAIAGLDALCRHLPTSSVVRTLWTVVIVILLAEPASAAVRNYLRFAQDKWERGASVRITRDLAAQWIDHNVPTGSRITHLMSDGFQFRPPYNTSRIRSDTRFLIKHGDILPYATFEPPSLDVLRNGSDFLIITDWQRLSLLWRLSSLGHNELHQRWEDWLNWMDRNVPSVRFSSPRVGYNYREVDIFLLAENPDLVAIESSLSALDSPVQLRRGKTDAPSP